MTSDDNNKTTRARSVTRPGPARPLRHAPRCWIARTWVISRARWVGSTSTTPTAPRTMEDPVGDPAPAIIGPRIDRDGRATTTPAGWATYAQAGQNYGYTLLWVLLLLIPVLIVNQEMVVRFGRGHRGSGTPGLINERFGRGWGLVLRR